MANKVFHVMYDDDQTLLDAARALVAQGVRVKEVFSPFPIHGLDRSDAHSSGNLCIYVCLHRNRIVNSRYMVFHGERLGLEHWRKAKLYLD